MSDPLKTPTEAMQEALTAWGVQIVEVEGHQELHHTVSGRVSPFRWTEEIKQDVLGAHPASTPFERLITKAAFDLLIEPGPDEE